jgi:hypothetical protein
MTVRSQTKARMVGIAAGVVYVKGRIEKGGEEYACESEG